MTAKPAKAKAKSKARELTLVNDQGATVDELKAGTNLAKQLPEVAEKWREYKTTEDNLRLRFWAFIDNLREPKVLTGPAGPMPAHRLNGREVTLLMLGLGEIKQRATEVKTLVEMDDAQFAAVRKLSLSKIEALKVARGSLELETNEKGEPTGVKEPKAAGSPATPNANPTKHNAPKEFKEAIHELIQKTDKLKATDDEVPYEFTGMTTDGRDYQVRIFVDSVPVGKGKE